MKILFDNGVPRPLLQLLIGHTVTRTQQLGWTLLKDGELIRRAEADYDVLVTTDQNIPFQQNLSKTRLAILILTKHNWKELRVDLRFTAGLINAVNGLQPGALVRFPKQV